MTVRFIISHSSVLDSGSLDFRFDAIGGPSPFNGLDSSFLSHPSTHRFHSSVSGLRQPIDLTTDLHSDRVKRPAPPEDSSRFLNSLSSHLFTLSSYSFTADIQRQDSGDCRSPEWQPIGEFEQQIKLAFDECLLQLGNAKSNTPKRRYFNHSIDNDNDLPRREDQSDVVNYHNGNDIVDTLSSTAITPASFTSTSRFTLAPYLAQDHSYKLVEHQFYNRLLKRHGLSSNSNQLPKCYSQIPAPPSCNMHDSSPDPWIVLNVHHLNRSRSRFCHFCFSPTHRSRLW